jgi:esterase/lipase superfamily enzyme
MHQPGELESPRLLKMEITQDPEKHIVLTHVEPMGQADFHSNLKAEMDRNGKSVFVFVHGYNVSFEDAARRTGQMAFDLKFPGAPIFYSWPSQANWYSYAKDQENIDLSVPQIRSFLLDIAAKSGADSIHLIAHSMGNVGLTAALQAMETESTPAFSQVVLAAPDIDAEVFQNEIASKVISKAKRTTLYTSKSDLALVASRYFNQRPRAGDSGPAVLIMDGMDTIDATAVDSSLLGHSYYGSNVTVLDDLGLLFQNKTIADRNYLRSALQNNRPYWEFQPLRLSREPSSPVIR